MTNPKKTWEEEFDKELKDFFSSEYEVCGRCGHLKENHWWNGGGRIENSGYDACHVEGCNCGFPHLEKLVTTYDTKNMNRFKQFISNLLSSQRKELRKKIEKMKIKVPENLKKLGFDQKGFEYCYSSEKGYNQAIDDILKLL